MVLPSASLNASSPDHLMEAYQEVGHALNAALRALDNSSPNARDYRSHDEWKQAVDEHRRRINCVRGVLSDIGALIDHIDAMIVATL